MITPNEKQDIEGVARHYDELSRYYLEVWGEHVHHGLWETGRESTEDATRNLVDVLARALAIGEGDAVCDVGCGYGATARHLASHYGASLTGLTISRAQFDFATKYPSQPDAPEYLLCDWLHNSLPDAAFDKVIFIESTEHMEDKAASVEEAFRVLKPGGKVGLYAWLAPEAVHGWHVSRLLEPICREGRLPGMASEGEYRSWLDTAGFTEIQFKNYTENVSRTWTVCLMRLAKLAATSTDAWRFALSRPENLQFLKSVLRIGVAYRVGAMGYGLFTAKKNQDG